MTISDPTAAYRQAAIENAPPLKLTRMLYQGSLRFLGQALEAHSEGDLPRFNERIGRAESIVCELRCSLDTSAAPELCKDLESLYLFVSANLVEAIASSSPEHVDHAMDVLRTLLAGWNDLDTQQGQA